jgi:hypothetical protein
LAQANISRRDRILGRFISSSEVRIRSGEMKAD